MAERLAGGSGEEREQSLKELVQQPNTTYSSGMLKPNAVTTTGVAIELASEPPLLHEPARICGLVGVFG